jgi:hypothetical protein
MISTTRTWSRIVEAETIATIALSTVTSTASLSLIVTGMRGLLFA